MHDIFSRRFYSLRTIPWHALGTVSTEEIGARDALSKIGPYTVELTPLQIVGDSTLTIAHKAIVRKPTDDDPEERLFGVVGPEYVLVTPQDAVEIWDSAVKRPVETLGSLGRGEVMFISTKLDNFAIKGDECENYLLLTSPMNGVASASIRITPVRVVCRNTLCAAAGAATETYRLVHDTDVKIRMRTWLSHIFERSLLKQRLLQQEFMAMADTPLSESQADIILRRAYPTPPKPVPDAPEEIMKERQESWEIRSRRVLERRGAALTLFQGDGTGMDHVACKGTAWGCYQAVCELEDWSRGHSDRTVGESALFGPRAATKERCYTAVMDYVHAQ